MRITLPLSSQDLKKWILVIAPSIVVLSVALIRFTTSRTLQPTNVSNTNQALACGSGDLSGKLLMSETTAYFGGKNVTVPSIVLANNENNYVDVLGTASPNEKWIEIDLSDQKIKAWDGTNLFLESLVSTGLPFTKTPTGEFKIWVKLRATKMEGGVGRNYYYLPNVPYVMYFGNDEVPNYKGYGLHGTYWHNDFGTPKSHGCVNLPTSVAESLYYWTTPVLSEGKGSVFSDEGNAGTRIVIHE